MLRSYCAALLLFAAPGAACAHPGHSMLATSFAEWLHLALGPDHLLGAIAAVALAIGLAVAVARRRSHKGRRHDSR